MIRISSCIILKNEMPYVMDLINQLSQFSMEVIVTDTGSTDGFLDPENLAKLPSNVKLTHFKWIDDFSAARNENFSHATGDMIFWCDADDVLNDVLMRKLIEFTSQDLESVPDLIDIQYQYWVERPDLFTRMRLFKRSVGLQWHERIHEYLSYDSNDPVEYFGSDAIILHAHRKPHGDRNLNIYHSMDSDGHQFTSRDYYYYANELFNARYFLPAYLLAVNCIRVSDGWHIDKINAVSLCATLKSYMGDNELPEIKELALELWNKNIYRADLACYIGDAYFDEEDYNSAIYYYECALGLGKPSLAEDFLCDPSKYGFYPALQLCLCYDRLGNQVKANGYNELAGSFEPNNEAIKHNRDYFKSIGII